MMRSMYSGVAGLKTHQTRMDVIGNNIANVNTVGFKASTVTFSDVFYQTTQAASGPNETTGSAGINAKQIGLGSSVAAIAKNITESGGSQTTNNPFDVMINGDTFFIVNNGGFNYFTKNGAFTVDANGTLCTSTGATVMGWQVDPDDETKAKSDTVSALRIMSPENLYAEPVATTDSYLTGNIDKKDTQIAAGSSGKAFQLSFYDSLGYSYTAKFVMTQTAESTDAYTVRLKDIVDQNNKSLFVDVTKDESGEVTYAQSNWQVGISTSPEGGEISTAQPTLDGDITEKNLDLTKSDELAFNVVFDGNTGYFKSLMAVGEVDASGLEGDAIAKSITLALTNTPNPFENLTIDFSKLTMFASSGSSSIESTMGNVDGLGKGKKAGNMSGVSIDSSGRIYGSYDNGDLKLLGQIAVASFANAAGLEAIGDSMFKETQNSGRFDGVGQDPKAGGGSLSTGVLEMSNVDLSAQFTDMITTQRGFQANSRIITTSDTLLEELINLKR